MNSERATGEEPEERARAPDYWTVRGVFGCVVISGVMARTVMDHLQRRRPPVWLRLCDLAGSEIWVRSRDVWVVEECTTEQRAYGRRLRRAIDREDEEDGNTMPDWRGP